MEKVIVGQDKEFTQFNYHIMYPEPDPNNSSLPMPEEYLNNSSGNNATVSLGAHEGNAGVARALIGVGFELDPGVYKFNYSWEEIKNWKITITIEFSYQIAASWTEKYGSSNAGVAIPYLLADWYAFRGREGSIGLASGAVKETYTITLDHLVNQLQNKIWLEVYSQAHVPIVGGTSVVNRSYSSVTLKSIKISFGPNLYVVVPGNTDNGTNMLSWFSSGAIDARFDAQCCVQTISQTAGYNRQQIIELITAKLEEARKLDKDLIVNIDMNLVLKFKNGIDLLKYLTFSPEWINATNWAAEVAANVSYIYRGNNFFGKRTIYAHSAGADAVNKSIGNSPDKTYDNINLLNGRTSAGDLAINLESKGYNACAVKVFTAENDLVANPLDSISYPPLADAYAGERWIHIHLVGIDTGHKKAKKVQDGHNWLRDNVNTPALFVINPSPYTEPVAYTCASGMLNWCPGY